MENIILKYILENVKEAEESGFELLVAFPQLNATYENPHLLQYLEQGYQIKGDQKSKKFYLHMV